jgi:NAD(P)-dependent dehydrogenase (short-subunit alcohol dehydrogenase family)
VKEPGNGSTGDPFRGRVAVVTGGASGIGLAMARAFAGRGSRLVLADVDEAALGAAEEQLRAAGARVLAVPTDVARSESVQALADAAFRHFGAVHIVCNNAGIAILGSVVKAPPEQWEKAMAINFWGVVHGVDAFVPRLVEQKQGGHVVNTASMAGLVGMQYLGVYCVTKFAVVGLTESLERELRPHDIGVHLLCPMVVATNIGLNSARLLGQPEPDADAGDSAQGLLQGGVITPEEVAARVVRGIEQKRLYILTHPEQREILERRAQRQDSAFSDGF